jgi:hypothetical protein
MNLTAYTAISVLISAVTALLLVRVIWWLAGRYHRQDGEDTEVELALALSIFVAASAQTVSALSVILMDIELGAAARGIIRAAILMCAVVLVGVEWDRRQHQAPGAGT